MGDPVSLTGTAVGIVSLGLTVCQGLVSYYNDFRAFSEDTRNVLEKLEDLKDVLEVLEDVLQSHDDLRKDDAATKTAKRNIMTCKSGLEKLEAIMNRCKATPGGQKRDYINRALYPFRRSTIKSLVEHVESLQSNLDTSMDVLQLSVVSQNSGMTGVLCINTERTLIQSTRIQDHVKSIDQTQQDISLTVSGIDQRLNNMYAYLGQRSQLALQSATLKQLCDGSEARPHNSNLVDTKLVSINHKKRSKCTCSSLSAFPKSKRGFFESLWYSPHHFGCPLYFQEKELLFEKRLMFPGKFLRTSVSVSLKTVRGAGGYTICPSLSFYPIVHELESPAFQLAVQARMQMQDSMWPVFFETFLNQLRSIYEERKASPKDVTSYRGSTILHKILKWIEYVPDSMMESYRNFIKDIIAFGVPVNEQSENGTALDALLFEGGSSFNRRPGPPRHQYLFIFSDLVGYGSGLTQDFSQNFKVHKFGINNSGDKVLVRCSSDYISAVARRNIHEDFNASDLEKSIIFRSENDLQEMISGMTMNEASTENYTYLAKLSIGWPAGLRIILDAGCRLDGAEILHCAIKARCIKSIPLLLNDINLAIDSSHIQAAHENDHSGIFELVVMSLAERRRKLQKLAERHLPVHIQKQLNLPTHGVLDSHAAQVYSQLQIYGIETNPCLKVDSNLCTVYDQINLDFHAAKILFNAGFQNFDEEEGGPDENQGLTAAMRVARSSRYCNRTKVKKVLDTMVFLISKGADPHKKWRRDGRTALHFLGYGVSGLLGYEVMNRLRPKNWMWCRVSSSKVRETIPKVFLEEWSQLDHSSWGLFDSLFVDSHCDSCSCACSAQGCVPCTMIFREVVRWTDSSPNIQAVAGIIQFLSERRKSGSVKEFHDILAPIVLRICIFDYLELSHTCCRKIDYWDDMADRATILEDISHIRDEQQILVEELESLITFFMSKYHEMGLGLPEFLLESWSVEIKKSSEPDAEEVNRIKSIGVILDE